MTFVTISISLTDRSKRYWHLKTVKRSVVAGIGGGGGMNKPSTEDLGGCENDEYVVILHLFKPIEHVTPRIKPMVNYGLG